MRYSSNKSKANISAGALWCLSACDITPDDAGLSQVAPGESRAMEKERGESRYLGNMTEHYGQVHRCCPIMQGAWRQT